MTIKKLEYTTAELHRVQAVEAINVLLNRASPSSVVYAENYGVVYDGLSVTPTDNKLAIEACISAAGSYGTIVFSGMAATSPITIERSTSNGLRLVGSSSVSDLNFTNNTPGLSIFSNNQSHILALGEDTDTLEGFTFENFVLHGRDLKCSDAALKINRWSQGQTVNFTITNVKGLPVKCRKWEDCDNYSFSLVKCGTPAGNEGGIMFDQSPDLSSNVIRFILGRFEWIDGPAVYLNSANSSAAVSHLTFIGTKFEIAERDGYGTNRLNNPLFDFRASDVDKCQNIRVLDCWISQASKCKEVLRLGKSHGVHIKGAKLSSADGGPVKLFTLSETNGTDARDFNWTDTSIINTSGNYSAFTIDVESNNINTMSYERPTEYNTNGSRLSNARSNILNANIIGIDGQMKPNPDNTTDPCLTPNKVVCARTGSSNSAIAWLGSSRYDKDGALFGFSGNMDKGLYEVRVRCKKSGNAANARIEIRGAAFLGQVDISNTTYEWKSIYLNTRGASGTMAITLSTFNQADHTIYVDAVEIIPVKDIFATTIPTTGTYVLGERVWYTTPTAGGSMGAICTVSGTPGTWKSMPNLGA